jgi:sodium transport system ATP-binding protein
VKEMKETLVVTNLVKKFRLSKKQMKINNEKEPIKVAVNNISFSTYKGEIYGLLGPNGAGKTTTLRCIATLIKPNNGSILVDGLSIKEDLKIKKRIGFLTNDLKLEEDFTPNYLYNYFSKFHELSDEFIEKRKKFLFDKFGINEFAEVKVGELSTGMRQKVSLAVSLVHDPDIIIFDEPTNGLDVLTAKTVTDYLQELREEGKTIIISTHIMSLVTKICDRVGIIINGKMIVSDTVKNVCALVPSNDLEDVFFELYKREMEAGGLL